MTKAQAIIGGKKPNSNLSARPGAEAQGLEAAGGRALCAVSTEPVWEAASECLLTPGRTAVWTGVCQRACRGVATLPAPPVQRPRRSPALWSRPLAAHQRLASSPLAAHQPSGPAPSLHKPRFHPWQRAQDAPCPQLQSIPFVPLFSRFLSKGRCRPVRCGGLCFLRSSCDCVTSLLMLQACTLWSIIP